MKRIADTIANLGHLKPFQGNARRMKQDKAVEGLAASMKEQGVLQPLLVRPVNGPAPVSYEIVCGHRRAAAAKLAGLDTVPVVVREMDDDEARVANIVENDQREDLHPLDQADGFRALSIKSKLTATQIADRIGQTPRYVSDRLRLLRLSKLARKQFGENRFPVTHAIALSEIPPEAQDRALDTESGGMYQEEELLFDPLRPNESTQEHLKPSSIKELRAWIAQHVKLAVENKLLPEIYPDTAKAVRDADEKEEKIVPITHEHYVQKDARDGQRVVGPRSWKRADGARGAKSCKHSSTGVIVVGPGRGTALKVCTEKKKCRVHWEAEQKESRARKARATREGTTGEDRFKKEQREREERWEKEEAERKRWEKAGPFLLDAVSDALQSADETIMKEAASVTLAACAPIMAPAKRAVALFPKPADMGSQGAADVVRLAAFGIVAQAAVEYRAAEEFPRLAKRFGINARAIVDEHAPRPEKKTTDKKRKARETKQK